MAKMNKCKPALGTAFVLALALSAIATPSFAQRSENNQAGGARERVIEQCSGEASKYKQTKAPAADVQTFLTLNCSCVGYRALD